MNYSYLNNIELEEAVKLYLKELKTTGLTLPAENIAVSESLGRITSEAVFAKISSPHYNACAMDGIALLAKNTFGATDTTPVILKEGADFERVDTGDPLPDNYDAVVMIEDVIENGDGTVKLLSAAAPWQHVRQIGEDICANEMITAANTRIEPATIGALLAGGVLSIKVRKKPIVGLIPTGDEIVSPTDNPGKGEIIEFNSSIFSAMLRNWGAEPKCYKPVPDDYNLLIQAVRRAADDCDVVIINAGSSAGREDFSEKVIGELGNVFVHGISIRPGKPTILGVVGSKPVIGVPGYPVSGIIVMEKIVKQVIVFLLCMDLSRGECAHAVLSRKIVSSLKYKEFVRMKLGFVDDRLIATPLNRGAGVVTSFVKADGILEIPLNSEGIEGGKTVSVKLLKSLNEIRNTLTVIGSHDPLIDVISDIMRRKCPDKYVSSAHVGSMGGIMSVKRGEAHAAGIHLLDETTGDYNIVYVKKYFPGEKINIIKCVKRIQGFMTAPGNPKSVNTVKDLSREGVSYVNRQKGAGTRILLDYLLKNENVDPFSIYGYEREEFTHMSVAALIAAGSADAGMGIMAAAKIYGLDFAPVCQEQYDFIVPQRFMELELVKLFIEIIRSREFKDALENMGGYIIEEPGEIIMA